MKQTIAPRKTVKANFNMPNYTDSQLLESGFAAKAVIQLGPQIAESLSRMR